MPLAPTATATRRLRFTTPDLLIVDDLGLRGLSGEEPLDLDDIIRQRYQQGLATSTSAIAVTSSASFTGSDLADPGQIRSAGP